MKSIQLIGLCAAALLTAGAVQAGQEFRERLSGASSTADLNADVRTEVEFGRSVAALILGRRGLDDDAEQQHYVNLIGHSVARHGSRQELDYRFAIIDSDQVNAYAAPGGYIFVTRPALELMEDEAELAGVLAHEVAHVNRRHIIRELKLQGEGAGLESTLAHLLGGAGDSARVAFNQAVDKAVEMLFDTGLKKEDEFEADQHGTLLLTATGYDPQALRRYLERVKEQKGEKTAILSHTHPSFDERLGRLDQLIEKERLASLEAPTLRDRFLQHMNID